MAEEHGFQAPEGHRLCVNNCGFFGSPATKNMCSKCYGDLCLKKTGDSQLFSTPLSVAPPSSSATAVQPITPAVTSQQREAFTAAQPTAQPMNRCFACRKKVGLTGFKCRCGTTFCGTHRYPEKHGCTFDFKALGRETIARDNPVIKADKLQKI